MIVFSCSTSRFVWSLKSLVVLSCQCAAPPLSSKPNSSPLLLLKFPNCGENLVRSFVHGEGSAFCCEASCAACRRVDLRRGEPGQGGEDIVEQVLPDVDHDVLVLPDPLHHCVPVLKCKRLEQVSKDKYGFTQSHHLVASRG